MNIASQGYKKCLLLTSDLILLGKKKIKKFVKHFATQCWKIAAGLKARLTFSSLQVKSHNVFPLKKELICLFSACFDCKHFRVRTLTFSLH